MLTYLQKSYEKCYNNNKSRMTFVKGRELCTEILL